jgi:hypothetical protein
MGNFARPLPVSIKSYTCSYACAVSYTKFDMDINSTISCKSLSEVMSFKFKVSFSPIKGLIMQFGFSLLHGSFLALARIEFIKIIPLPRIVCSRNRKTSYLWLYRKSLFKSFSWELHVFSQNKELGLHGNFVTQCRTKFFFYNLRPWDRARPY